MSSCFFVSVHGAASRVPTELPFVDCSALKWRAIQEVFRNTAHPGLEDG